MPISTSPRDIATAHSVRASRICRKAYFNASLADRFKAEDAGALRDEIGKKLKPDVRKKVDQEVDLFVEQNGK